VKGELVASLELAPDGSPLANPAFRVAAASFNGLVAFNALELADITGDGALADQAEVLVDALDQRWDPSLATWVDAGDSEAGSGRVRTLDALLPALVSRRTDAVDAAFAQMLDGGAFGGRSGPAQVHRDEPAFAARTYWRGPAWPQLTYLAWAAARRAGRAVASDRLARMLVDGAERSGWAEYWDADDGTGLGAVPQSWATLAMLVV
jgi:glycogen debranching enzyme